MEIVSYRFSLLTVQIKYSKIIKWLQEHAVYYSTHIQLLAPLKGGDHFPVPSGLAGVGIDSLQISDEELLPLPTGRNDKLGLSTWLDTIA